MPDAAMLVAQPLHRAVVAFLVPLAALLLPRLV